jgi:hypothetical protein
MMLPLLHALIALPIMTFGIGAPLVRSLRLHPAESLALAAGLSWLVVFNVAFAAYLGGVPGLLAWPIYGGSMIGLWLGRREVMRWFHCPFTRSMIGWCGMLVLWCLAFQAASPIYAYGDWFGDWYEHYERLLFFVERRPIDTVFLGRYSLTARPPMQNVCQAVVATVAGTSFAVFQISATFLAVLSSLPVFLLIRRLARGAGPPVAVAAGLLAFNWPFVVHATFTWTKALSAGYVLLAIAFYLRGTTVRQTFAFIMLAAGVLVHYSSAVVLVPLVIWHLVTHAASLRSFAKAAAVGVPGAVLLLPWVMFVSVWFTEGLLGGTSSASMAKAAASSWLSNSFFNGLVSVVPVYSTKTLLLGRPRFSLDPLYVRDLIFMFTMCNWVGASGLTGLLMTTQEVAWRRRRWRMTFGQAGLWVWLFAGSLAVLSLSHPSQPKWGILHIAMLPFVLATVSWIAGAWPRLSRGMRGMMAGLASLQSAGMLLNAFLLVGKVSEAGERLLPLTPDGAKNMLVKSSLKITFLADLFEPARDGMFALLLAAAAGWMVVLVMCAFRPESSSDAGVIAPARPWFGG